jgi:hypothetical protein
MFTHFVRGICLCNRQEGEWENIVVSALVFNLGGRHNRLVSPTLWTIYQWENGHRCILSSNLVGPSAGLDALNKKISDIGTCLLCRLGRSVIPILTELLQLQNQVVIYSFYLFMLFLSVYVKLFIA